MKAGRPPAALWGFVFLAWTLLVLAVYSRQLLEQAAAMGPSVFP